MKVADREEEDQLEPEPFDLNHTEGHTGLMEIHDVNANFYAASSASGIEQSSHPRFYPQTLPFGTLGSAPRIDVPPDPSKQGFTWLANAGWYKETRELPYKPGTRETNKLSSSGQVIVVEDSHSTGDEASVIHVKATRTPQAESPRDGIPDTPGEERLDEIPIEFSARPQSRRTRLHNGIIGTDHCIEHYGESLKPILPGGPLKITSIVPDISRKRRKKSETTSRPTESDILIDHLILIKAKSREVDMNYPITSRLGEATLHVTSDGN